MYHSFSFLEWRLPSIYTLYMNEWKYEWKKLSFINFNRFSFAFLSRQVGQSRLFSLCFLAFSFPRAVNVYQFSFILSNLRNKKEEKIGFFWLFCVGFEEIVDCVGVWFIWKKRHRKRRGEGGLSNFIFLLYGRKIWGWYDYRWSSLASETWDRPCTCLTFYLGLLWCIECDWGVSGIFSSLSFDDWKSRKDGIALVLTDAYAETLRYKFTTT